MRTVRFLTTLAALAVIAMTGCAPNPSPSPGDAISVMEPGVGTATVLADRPFVLRLALPETQILSGPWVYGLEVQHNDQEWVPVPRADFPYPEEQTPVVSITGADAVQRFDQAPDTLSWSLVIRRWADGAVTSEDGDRFTFRLTVPEGEPLDAEMSSEIRLAVPDYHVGGTFVETPGRIGPWQRGDGTLYFIMEPTETDNVLMMVRSEDHGRSWHEVDGSNRPKADDLEGLASVVHDGVIHILHQQSLHVWYHAFSMPMDRWVVRDELVSEPGKPPVQVAALETLVDGTLMVLYGDPQTIVARIRLQEGSWGEAMRIDPEEEERLSGPMMVRIGPDAVRMAYTASSGSLWTRRWSLEEGLGNRVLVSTRMDTTESAVGSVLPLAFDAQKQETVLVYRESDGQLRERRVRKNGSLSDSRILSHRKVVQNAVDSDQVGADMIFHDGQVHVLFIEEGSGNLFYTVADRTGAFSTPVAVASDVNVQWVRGQVVHSPEGLPLYGYVVDAGSNGGSGMNRYAEIALKR